MRPTIASLLLLLIAAPAALAQVDSHPLAEAERREKLERAAQLQAEAARLESEADAKLKATNAACYKKFLISSCLEDAKRTHTQEVRVAKRMELEGTELERDVKRRDLAAKDAQRAAEAPQRAAEQQAQGEAYRAEEAQRAEERAAKLADKERKAAENRQKLAAEQAKREKKLAAQAQKEAKAAEKRRAREAKEAARAARKAEKEAASAAAPTPAASPSPAESPASR